MKKLSDFNLVFGVYANGGVANYQGPKEGLYTKGIVSRRCPLLPR